MVKIEMLDLLSNMHQIKIVNLKANKSAEINDLKGARGYHALLKYQISSPLKLLTSQ